MELAEQMQERERPALVDSHSHTAMQCRKLVHFLRPEDEARTRAVTEAVDGLPLAVAAVAVEEKRVVASATGEPMEWEAGRMVLPVSERLRSLVSGPEYEASVEREQRRLSFRLLPARRPPSVRRASR
jgi:hypothetical protein